MKDELVALANGRQMGLLSYRSGRLSFAYDESWQLDPGAYPLSLSMPLGSSEHGHAKVHAFLWGLLPDNDRVLENWGKRFHVSPNNAFRLISNVGEDCAGAVQFISTDRLPSLRAEPASREVEWLTEDDIAERLRVLRADHSAWRAASDSGQFSLAGAQPKTALFLHNGRWGVPSGRTPTTHILKPPTGEWDGHAENEHFCLRLARASGLVVPNSSVLRFGAEVAIVIERYDRVYASGAPIRVHQEDFCQALAVHPARKYENEGGPGVREIVAVLRQHSSNPEEDNPAFLDAIVFNWLIAGTDGHAKNYAVLLGSHGAVRLAPFYDLASILPYPRIDPKKAKLAMKIGGEYRLANIGMREWRRLAADLRTDPDSLISRIKDMASRLPDLIPTIRNQVKQEGLTHPTIPLLARKLIERTRLCRSRLQ